MTPLEKEFPLDLGTAGAETRPLWSLEECPSPGTKGARGVLLGDEWSDVVQDLLGSWEKTLNVTRRLDALAKEVLLVKNRVRHIEEGRTVRVPIQTLAPEPYSLLKPFEVVVRKCEDDFVATFYDANLSASGDTAIEAVTNLKDIIVTTLEIFEELGESRLGPEPKRQLQILKSFIAKAK